MKRKLYLVFCLATAVMLSGCQTKDSARGPESAVSSEQSNAGAETDNSAGVNRGTDAAGAEAAASGTDITEGQAASGTDTAGVQAAAPGTDAAIPASLPPVTAPASLLSPSKAHFTTEYTPDGDIAFFADLTHDGKKERITAGLAQFVPQGEASNLTVHASEQAGSPVLWQRDYGTSHVGWVMLYLYEEDGKDYLMQYTPAMYQGAATYALDIFSLDADGNVIPLRRLETSFQLHDVSTGRNGFFGDPKQAADFLDEVRTYQDRALLLVSTDEGTLAYSTPEHPVTAYHDDSAVTGSWDLSGSHTSSETLRTVEQKNWAESEGIPLLSGLFHFPEEAIVHQKGIGRLQISTDKLCGRLFSDLSGDTWALLPGQTPPSKEPDVLVTISSDEASDTYLSFFRDEKLAVIWTAPFVCDIDNHMRSIEECYRVPGNVIDEMMEWAE